MANQWFRLYAEFATDPKVQMMTEAMQRRYIMLLCLHCSNSLVTLQDEEVAFQLRIDLEELEKTKSLFLAKGLIGEGWSITGWEKRQYASDSSAARVAAHRQRKKEAGNADVTLQKQPANGLDTDSDTDTDKNLLSESADSADPSACPQLEIVSRYNQTLAAKGWVAVNPKLWKGARADALRARWREEANRQSLEWWDGLFAHVQNSDWLMGKIAGRDGRPFRGDLEWLVTLRNFNKVCEGKYHG